MVCVIASAHLDRGTESISEVEGTAEQILLLPMTVSLSVTTLGPYNIMWAPNHESGPIFFPFPVLSFLQVKGSTQEEKKNQSTDITMVKLTTLSMSLASKPQALHSLT
jgi:hypothetical protein